MQRYVQKFWNWSSTYVPNTVIMYNCVYLITYICNADSTYKVPLPYYLGTILNVQKLIYL